jgi:hypothetical protein
MELEPRERNRGDLDWPGDLRVPSLPYDPPQRDPSPDVGKSLPYDPPQPPEPSPQQDRQQNEN